MCQDLSYNLTSFPNIWLSIADQTEAAYMLRQYSVCNNTQNPVCNVYCIVSFYISTSSSLARCWWSWIVLSPCGSSCVRCLCHSAVCRVVCCSRAAPCVQQQSSSVHMIWSSLASAGPLTVTYCLMHTTPSSALCHRIQHCLHWLVSNHDSTLYAPTFLLQLWVFFFRIM